MSQPALTRPGTAVSASKDPLLQPFKLRHLNLKNRVVSTCHEPAYSEDGLPKERYRLYHVEKAKGGCAMTMIGGSATVDVDSPQAFGNLRAGTDEIIPWFRRLADSVHEYDCAVMCQITHLGRRAPHRLAAGAPQREEGIPGRLVGEGDPVHRPDHPRRR